MWEAQERERVFMRAALFIDISRVFDVRLLRGLALALCRLAVDGAFNLIDFIL